MLLPLQQSMDLIYEYFQEKKYFEVGSWKVSAKAIACNLIWSFFSLLLIVPAKLYHDSILGYQSQHFFYMWNL